MKNIILIIGVLLLASCHRGGDIIKEDMEEFNTIIVEDCEYIYDATIGLRSLTHKGNCKNPIHKCK